jgi:thiol-disulfide isomerase/thioredoxin
MNKKIIILLVIFLTLGISTSVFFYNQMTSDKSSISSVTSKDIKTNKKSEILAGEITPYVVFTQSAYEKALQEKKIIFLEFYANWCPICRAQEPALFEGFTELDNNDIVGFRVNYNDDKTDDTERQLAKDFGVTYQHTHVILKDGKVISKSNDQLDKESFLKLITK